jgi:hypothetical protein
MRIAYPRKSKLLLMQQEEIEELKQKHEWVLQDYLNQLP